MASIGLKVNDGGGIDTSLADTLAKAYFGDPDQQAKIALARAHIASQGAYQAKLGADTSLVQQKTRDDQALADVQDAAAKTGPTALNAAVPMPVPVEASRANAPGTTGYGPQPGIVDLAAQRMHDAQIQQNNALWPVIVRSGNATQLIEAAGKGEGLSALSGGLVPGSRPDPNVQRVAGGLYTGSAPTTSTVWSPGDTAGQQAEAGKDIAVARAKLPEPKMFGDQPYTVQLGPDGQPLLTPTPGFQPTAKPPERQVVDGVVYERQPNGVWAKAQGIAPPAPGEPGAFGGQNSVDGVSARVVSNTSVKMQDQGYKPTSQEALDYATSYNRLYQQPKQGFEKNAAGDTILVTTMPEAPAGVMHPNEVFSRAGIKVTAPSAPQPPTGAPLAAEAPVASPIAQYPPASAVTAPAAPIIQSPSARPVGAPAAAPSSAPTERTPAVLDQAAASLVPGGNVRVQKIMAGGGAKPTEQQSKDRTFVARALMGTTYLDHMQKGDIPDVWSNYIADPNASGITSAFLQSNLPSDTRNYITARTAFGTAQLRNESGAAINPSEFRQTDTTYDPVQLAYKKELRHSEIRTLLESAYSGDPQGYQNAVQQAKERGVDLTPNRNAVPTPASGRNAAPAADANIPPAPPAPRGVDPAEWGDLWLHMRPEGRAKFLPQAAGAQ